MNDTINPTVSKNSTSTTRIALTVILVLAAFGSGVFAGKTMKLRESVTNADGSISVQKVVNLDRSINHSNEVDFNQFWQVWDKVKAEYVKQPISDADLFYGALEGMVAGLGDPYSMYFRPSQADNFAKSLAGELEGIGAEIGVKQNQLVVIAPLADTPAARADLRPGDKILAIDKLSTMGMDTATAVTHIRGPATSSVTLTIAREGWAKPKDLVIHRAKINIPSVRFEMKPGNIAYMHIMQFNEQTIPQFSKYIDQLKKANAKGVILDLRSNPGGYLDGAIAMASEWVESGPVVGERFSGGQTASHDALEIPHRLHGIRTVVLINGGSASASEIVSGALQDTGAATVIGEKSFGKGSVQNYESLPDGSALKVTIAEWLTPKGNNINQTGIKPDIEVKEDYSKEAVGEDSVISKALDIINGKVNTSTQK